MRTSDKSVLAVPNWTGHAAIILAVERANSLHATVDDAFPHGFTAKKSWEFV
jgi:hypothetical protein